MEKTSLLLFNKEHDATLKLDYFICGVAGALFAYIGQNYTPHKLDDYYFYLMPLALFCLTVSFGCGIRNLSLNCLLMECNRKEHFALEDAKYFFDSIQGYKQNPPKPICNVKTNVPWTVEGLEFERNKSAMEADRLNKDRISFEKKANCYGKVRTFFLIVGFLLILASNILQPYFAK